MLGMSIVTDAIRAKEYFSLLKVRVRTVSGRARLRVEGCGLGVAG